jgi:UDP-N-acetylmuramoyl-tripeptide--D-alanyl-D-alanine ligase
MDEPLWTFQEISAALGPSRPDPVVDGIATGVSIDSRTLQPDDLFVAIKGDRADGHRFVAAAFEKGAAATIVAHDFDASLPSGSAVFRVPDTLEALNALARASRKRSGARIVAVTGSAGKTGTKEMLRSMLSASGPTHASEKSYNNLWGVPLSLARMPRNSRFGIFEIGMNHAGEITPLTRMVSPHVAIVTWVAPVHMEFFNSVAEIADAKAEIFKGLEQGGIAILPADNEHFARLAAKARENAARVVTFGEDVSANARLSAFRPLEAGSQVTASILGESVTFILGAPGRHLAANALAALAAVQVSGASVNAAAEALAQFEAPEGRGRRTKFETPEGWILIIDETYNANPASMRAALEVLGEISRTKYARRIAVLGDMLELGHAAPQFHAELASVIDSNGIDLVFCAGPLMSHLYDRIPAHKRGGSNSNSHDLIPAVLHAVRGGDVVTIKGSLGSRMGLLANTLCSRFEQLSAQKQGRDAA